MGSLATITAGLSTVAEVISNLDKIKEFVSDAVLLAQTVATTGQAKLAAVVAATQAFIASLTTEIATAQAAWAAIKDEITAFINGAVTLWKSLSANLFTATATTAA